MSMFSVLTATEVTAKKSSEDSHSIISAGVSMFSSLTILLQVRATEATAASAIMRERTV